MVQRQSTGSEIKQMPLRLDRELYEELSRRSTIENRPMSDIVREALRSHFDAVRVTKPQLRAAIAKIAREDAEILAALAKGPQEHPGDESHRLPRRR
jgi:hypothetical protein